ncbi:hypothetical protein [Pseudomonas germanica]
MSVQKSRHNHYVPVWYQKRFLPAPGVRFFFLDLRAPIPAQAITKRSPKGCFAAPDLYTTWFGVAANDEIERLLFGDLDNTGAVAVKQLVTGSPAGVHQAFEPFFTFLGAQRMRTPKALDWIKERYLGLEQNPLMGEMQHLLNLNLTLWGEAVREIVSAKDSDVKFLITDNPVTLYNPAYLPEENLAREPSSHWNGTQIIYALDADHLLILTHLDYAKTQPNLDLLADRINSRSVGRSLINTQSWIRARSLSREEVININHVLKVNACQYLAAVDKSWLYPEQHFAGSWADIAAVLKPPDDGLFDFGGEMYIGYQDGSVDYQDSYGRSSKSHEYLAKKVDEASLEDDHLCGCGNGSAYAECCKLLPAAMRPSWTVASLRERNLIFIHRVCSVLGLDDGKEWIDIQTELSDEQVVEIHKAITTIWPDDTNLRELWPRPNPNKFRGVYMGLIDPRTVIDSVLNWTTYFDEVVLLNPFPNPSSVTPKFNPIENPGQHKAQTLKNVFLLMQLEPFIEAGIVHLVPDPADLDLSFRHAFMAIARGKPEIPGLGEDETGLFERLVKEDTSRAITQRHLESVISHIRQANPHVPLDEATRAAIEMQQLRRLDPFALLQPPGDGDLLIVRSMNLELGMLTAQLMGAVLYADHLPFWRLLQNAVTSATVPADVLWTPLVEAIETAEFVIPFDPLEVFQIRAEPVAISLREAFRELMRALQSAIQVSPEKAVEIAEKITSALHEMRARYESPEHLSTAIYDVECAIPCGGLVYTPVQRLALSYGPDTTKRCVPMTLFMKRRGG